MAESGVPPAEASHGSRTVSVFDCRPQNKESSKKMLDISGMNYKQFLCAVRKEFSVSVNESFVITTTDRRKIDSKVYDEIPEGKTLHLLQSVDQELAVATEEQIKYIPHFHTIVQSGQYEYYASEGQKALPYAFAELIDNALSATSRNPGNRSIDIRLYFDESQGGPAVVVMDNGCGMTAKELNNWAVYRLSKFNRDDRTFRSDESGYVRPSAVPRSLNSDISYFGVGGKQAVFYIGQSVRIISKPVGSPDVHEFVMSKEDFEQKEKNNKEIYSGVIRNRKPGDDSHVRVDEERFLQALVLEEKGKDSFTNIVITAVQPEHVTYLKQDFNSWTRELAHIYHYYVHGVNGNDRRGKQTSEAVSDIDIQIYLIERNPRLPRVHNLRAIDNDMQTLYINSSVAEFEFKASKGGDAKVEGLLRYHPFLYDRETYPEDPYAVIPATESDEDCFVSQVEGRGKRPVFECFWNGRLIPYSSVAEFEWCARPKKVGSVPLECYNRISGVLFSNDRFQVSTNKLTFMDLELQLRDKNTIFTRVLNGQEQRVKINKEFTNWLKECHERYDKQVKFLGFQGVMTRTDVQPKRKQSPWARYKAIVWDGKTYKTGQQIKTVKTPNLYGTIVQFLLYGDHNDDVYANEGHVQIALEPKEVYNEIKILPITKINRQATDADIKEYIESELNKLPDRLSVTWPEGTPWPEKTIRPAGTPMGPIKVEILNKKGETISRWPVSNVNSKKFQIELKVIWHSPSGDVKTNSHIGVHSKWEYWFRKMENLNELGTYTLHLQSILSDGDSTINEWAGRQLPHYTLNFSIKESSAAAFTVGVVPSPVHVGVPFALLLKFTDAFSHPTRPPSGIKPQLESSSLKLSYEQTTSRESTFTIQDLRATGQVSNHQDKIHAVKVTIPGLYPDSQSFQISVCPGPPHQLVVKPKDEVCIENGKPAGFKVEVQDEFHNITTHSKLIVRCQLFGCPDLPADTVDCSNTGSGLLLAKPIQLKNVTTERILTAKFGIPNQKAVACVERTIRILPSTHVFRIEVYRQEADSDDVMVLQNKERINWTAGDTLGSLHFRLYDEGGRQVALTQRLVQNIKMNWAATTKAAELAKGILPCVCVPTKAHREQFYQVAFQDQHTVDTSFTIIPRPDEPERLRATLSETSVRMGETLSRNINVEVIDQYGNKTDALSADSITAVTVSADNLDKSALNFDWKTSTGTMVVTGVRFVGGLLGPRELCFKFQKFEEFVRINVTPGPPAKITLLEAPEQPIHVLNGHGLGTPFLLQLCDEWGNPVPDQRVVIAIKTLSSQLKVKSLMSQPVDKEGRASFLLETITATIGEHELEFRGSFSRTTTISGPVVKLCVKPDPNNPVKLIVEYDSEAVLRAGDIFPVFKVTVISEEGGPVKNVSPSSLSMLLWPGLASGSHPPPEAVALKCSKPRDKENDDHFYFRDKEIPVRVGKYMVQFFFGVEKSKSLWSSQIALSIVANMPVKLVPDTPVSTPVVSNSSTLAARTLLEMLRLKIMDEHNNPAGMGINGKVILTVKTVDGVDADDIPMFENKAKSLTYDLINGETVITSLALMENSQGADGAVYLLQFRAVIEVPKSKATIPPFNLPFRFYNDAESQMVVATMCKKKDQLSQSIDVYKAILETNKQLTTELRGQVHDAANKETQLKLEIKKSGIDVSKLTDVKSIEDVVTRMTEELERLQNLPRRKCVMPDPFRDRQDVLGKIVHLALVNDDDAAKVISWHLLGDMDCVITVTTAAAKKIYDETQGLQQVMPLETIFLKPNNRPLPHIRNGQNVFTPLGNPVFVRDLLIFPKYAESCNMVFSVLLGDTILVDDLDSANHYRKGVVQTKVQCPTLLTRRGERIRSTGKFGGLQNKAPPIEKLRGNVFGAPLPQEYHNICKQKEMLKQYSIAVQNASKVKAEYDNHMDYLQSPKMKQNQQELQQQEKELRNIEKKLASTPVRTSPGSVKRSLQEDDDETLPAKRIRRKTRKLLDF